MVGHACDPDTVGTTEPSTSVVAITFLVWRPRGRVRLAQSSRESECALATGNHSQEPCRYADAAGRVQVKPCRRTI